MTICRGKGPPSSQLSMPVTSFVVTGTALRAAPGRPFPLPSKTFSSDLHAGPRLRMKDRQTRGARSVPDRAPLVWTSFEQGTRASRSPPPAPWTAAPDCPKWTPWYTVEETRPARSPTLPMQKCPVVVTGRFLCLSKANRAVLHPLRGTGHLFSACGVTPPAGDQSKSFGKGEGSMRGEGDPFPADCQMNCTASRIPFSRSCSTVER